MIAVVGRRRTEARRQEILRTAVTVVTERGFARTRVQDIAEILGVSTGLIFYHFESKDKLLTSAFLHVLENDMARLERVLRRPWSATRRLRGVIRLYDPVGAYDGWVMDIDAWAEGRRIPELGTASRAVENRFANAIRDLVVEGVGTGEFSCANPKHATERIVAMLDGLAVGVHVRQRMSRNRAVTWGLVYVAAELGITVEQLTRKDGTDASSEVVPLGGFHPDADAPSGGRGVDGDEEVRLIDLDDGDEDEDEDEVIIPARGADAG
jgi:AcrR family transcriptional regulator